MNRQVLMAVAAIGISALSTVNMALADDMLFKGEQVFRNVCSSCHALPADNKNAVGPSLHGVVGRHAGRAPGYTYSSAMKDSNIVWTEEQLDGYLTSPQKYVGPIGYPPHKEVKMTFPGLKDPADRKATIAFLKAN